MIFAQLFPAQARQSPAGRVDGDGHPDLVFGNYFRDGDRVLDARATGAFEMQHSMSRAYNGGRNRLLLWRGATAGTVSYRDASDAFTADMATAGRWRWARAISTTSLIQLAGEKLAKYRHLPEIYVANDFGPDRLLLNRSTPGRPRFELVEGQRGFTTPRSKVLGQDSFKGMGVDFGDVTEDGRAAIAVSNISSPYALLESHFLFTYTGDANAWLRGKAPYRDDSFDRGIWTSGWAWDIKFADLLNSGRPALLQAIGFVRGERSRWPELQELAMGNDELLRSPGIVAAGFARRRHFRPGSRSPVSSRRERQVPRRVAAAWPRPAPPFRAGSRPATSSATAVSPW